MEAQAQHVSVRRDGVGVRDATVTVNGVTIPHLGAGTYKGELPAPVPAGSPLELRVSAGGLVVKGTVSVPEAPALTTTPDGSVVTSSGSITVQWTSDTDPDRFLVAAGPVFPRQWELPGTAREFEIQAYEGLHISVTPCNDGQFSGPAHPDSRMVIRGEAAEARVTITHESRQ